MDKDDEWILKDFSKTLADYGVENETELSVFNFEQYKEYSKDPQEKW
jgi:hypothetical protein